MVKQLAASQSVVNKWKRRKKKEERWMMVRRRGWIILNYGSHWLVIGGCWFHCCSCYDGVVHSLTDRWSNISILLNFFWFWFWNQIKYFHLVFHSIGSSQFWRKNENPCWLLFRWDDSLLFFSLSFCLFICVLVSQW